MYGRPDRQTVGGAVVSFLLRPCAFSSLVVFGARQEGSPVFTSFSAWTGQEPAPCPDGERELVRKYLRCYGPSTAADFAAWLGSSPKQARRLWNSLAEELMPVQVEGRTRYLPAGELDALTESGGEEERLLLLGPHDPYLDLRDRWVVLPGPGSPASGVADGVQPRCPGAGRQNPWYLDGQGAGRADGAADRYLG